MKTIGLISSHQEGYLLPGAIDSAGWLDHTIVFEGPAARPMQPRALETTETKRLRQTVDLLRCGTWLSDASKRWEMVKWCQDRLGPGPLWGVWIDGDELLMYGECLGAYLERIATEDRPGHVGYKFPLRIVEFDGSVALCHGKVVRIDLVERYHVSSYGVSFTFAPGLVMSLGNEPNWKPATIDEQGRVIEHQDPTTPTHRPPLQGEPHLLHRSPLRDPERAKLRMHDAEADAFREMVESAGLENV